jgi:H+/Cl- antiporter ClcA
MGASVAGDLVAGYFFGLKPVFDFHFIVPLQANRFAWIIVLGIVCAFAGDLFKRSLNFAQDTYKRLRIPPVARPLVAVLVSIPFGLFLFDVTGGGHHLIIELSREHFAFEALLVLLVGKLALTAVSYGSGAAGGIFLPLLACGALVGEIFGNILAAFSLIPDHEALNFMIIGMAAFFTAVARAPVTGALLILEMCVISIISPA